MHFTLLASILYTKTGKGFLNQYYSVNSKNRQPDPDMKPRNILPLFISLLLIARPALAQFNSVKYVSYGYFTGLSLADSLMVQDTVVISIDQKKIEILDVDPVNAARDVMFFESRTMSALKYPATDGAFYYVWKLGDRKMILRQREGIRYLSLYQTDEYGLPKEYITFKIKE